MSSIHVLRIEQCPVMPADLMVAPHVQIGRVDLFVGELVSGYVRLNDRGGKHRVSLTAPSRRVLDADLQGEVRAACLNAFLAVIERQAVALSPKTGEGPER